jgi:hypothetical protein
VALWPHYGLTSTDSIQTPTGYYDPIQRRSRRDLASNDGSVELLEKGEHGNHGIRKAGDPVQIAVPMEVGPDELARVAEKDCEFCRAASVTGEGDKSDPGAWGGGTTVGEQLIDYIVEIRRIEVAGPSQGGM